MKEKMKIIGIGVKDDSHYVKYFQETFKVKFPLFPDKDREIHRMIGEPNTPYFIVVKVNEKREISIFYTHMGQIQAADKFINDIKDASRKN